MFSSPDGLDKTTFSMADGSSPVLIVSTAFDISATVNIDYGIPADLGNGTCSISLFTPHYQDQQDNTLGNISITAPIQFGIDPTSGKLTLTVEALQVNSFDITLGANGCGSLIDGIVSVIGGTISSFLNSSITNVIANLATAILQPQINALVQGFLPNPLGIAGVVDTSTLLGSFEPPANAGLETYLVPGGYVSSKANGLTLGVLAGMNSDANPATRTAALASEPNLCVPARPPIALAAAPYNLPANAVRSDFTLNPADQFSGTPDPVDPMGNPRDVLIGLSRTYLDVIGFHVYNSGSLSLHVDGATVGGGMLNTGTLSAFIPSLSNIALEPKAPLELQLRPQEAALFTLGAGTTTDPLIHIALTDLRIDMYAWVEQRWARVLTLALDLNIGVNLTVTKNAAMQPVLQPTLSGLTAANVVVRVSNSDLLSEPPAQLAMLLPSIISLAGGALTGALPTFALPSVAGFTLTDLTIGRVQTTQDDFIGIYGTLATPTSPTPLVDWSDPVHPRLAGEVRTQAKVARVVVPSIEEMRQLLETPMPKTAANPKVELALGADGANGQPLEFSWKIDNSIWHDWSPSSTPTLEGGALMFQGNHVITVRSRIAGDYLSEDTQPVTLNVAIDAQPPGVNPKADEHDPTKLDLNGWDLVTANDDLEYAFQDGSGAMTAFAKLGPLGTLSSTQIGTYTNNGTGPLVVQVRDQAGFVGQYTIPVSAYLGMGSWGRPLTKVSSGCACTMGGAATNGAGSSATLAFLGLGFLLAYRSRRRVSAFVRRGAGRGLVTIIVVGVAAIQLAGCGCDKTSGQCIDNDDCAKMQCNAGQIPVCQTKMCACTPDIPLGQVGRYASMTYLAGTAYVAAYNETYGDLMIGSIAKPGVISNWDFVDGVPDQSPSLPGGHVRGGVSAPGDDVGQYTSISYTPAGDPVIAYYDATHAALKYASFGAIRWHSHTVDVGTGTPATNGDDVGTWASLSLDKEGRPGIAYTAIVKTGTASGMPEGQLRWAQAKTNDPQSASDWTVTVVDKRAVGVPLNADLGAPPDLGMVDVLPDVIAIMASAARRSDDSPGIVYYDRALGNLRYATLSGSTWTTSILDGQAANGADTGDEGEYPSLVYDAMDVGQVAYADAEHDSLNYINTKDLIPEIVDDGYRPMDETTTDGLPSPVYHLVGDSASLQLVAGKVVIAYQDATDEELMLATGSPGDGSMNGMWTTQKLAGHDNPFAGSYGFWATAKAGSSGVYSGSYAINQQLAVPTYYYQVFFTDLGVIQ